MLAIFIVEEVLVVERRLHLKEGVRISRTERQRPIREVAQLRSGVTKVETIVSGSCQASVRRTP